MLWERAVKHAEIVAEWVRHTAYTNGVGALLEAVAIFFAIRAVGRTAQHKGKALRLWCSKRKAVIPPAGEVQLADDVVRVSPADESPGGGARDRAPSAPVTPPRQQPLVPNHG